MKDRNILLILLGFISILAQTIFLREMLMEVNGNEIIFSVYLSLWLFLIALGSYISRYITKSKKVVPLVFSLLLFLVPLQFYLIRVTASALTLVSGQIINLPAILLLGLLILAPGCLLLGFLFPHLCRMLRNKERTIHIGYILECIGMITGSILFAVSVRFLPQFSLLCLLSTAGYFILFISFRQKVILIPLLIFLLILPFSNQLYKRNYSKRYNAQTMLSSQDSFYGRLDITETRGQKNYYWNGVLFASDQDEMYAQQMINFVMLQHPEPAEILVVGGLLNGSIPEILNYKSVENIDYLEMDINILKQAESMDFVYFIQADPIRYIQKTQKKYDLIFLDLPDPSSLFLNRYYTREFFNSLTGILKDSLSVVAITLSSGTNYMTNQIINLNSTIYHTFSSVYPHTILIPSIKNIFIGSKGDYISNQVQVLSQRLLIDKPFFNKTVIFEKCNKLKIEQSLHAINSVPVYYNTFANPRAYLSTILLWTDILNFKISPLISFFQSQTWLIFIISFLLILVTGWIASILGRSKEPLMDLSIYSVSLVNFVMELVLLNIFQMQFGYVYFIIFLFTASFMLGLVAGFIVQKNSKIPIGIIWIINLILIMVIYVIFSWKIPVLIYFLFNIAFAFLEGIMLAEILDRKAATTDMGSTFYFLDTLGAMTGGIIFSIILIPLTGIRNSLILLVVIITANLSFSIKKNA